MNDLQKYFPVAKAEKQQILEGYNKTQSDVDNDVNILKSWISKQRHLPQIEDDLFFELLLLRNKFQMERTKEKIDKYFSMKNVYRDFFESLDPCDENIILATKYFRVAIMPKLTPELRRVIYIELKLEDENVFSHAAMTYVLTIAMETQIRMDYTDAIELVLDAGGFSMGFLTKIDVSMLHKTTKIFFEAFSGRISGLHILNASSAVEILLSMFKPLLPSKLKDKILVHTDTSDIFNIIPKNCLPSEIGGTGPCGSKSADAFAGALRDESNYIIKRNELASNEDLRIGDRPNQNNLFGIQGTFKQINID